MFYALARKAMTWKKAGKKVSGSPKLTAKGLIVVNLSDLASASKELGMPPKILRARWKYATPQHPLFFSPTNHTTPPDTSRRRGKQC